MLPGRQLSGRPVGRSERIGGVTSSGTSASPFEQYEVMLADQFGGCAICRRPPRPNISLHVDHDHETARVRGLLCIKYNNALGDFEDDPSILTAALRYLEPPVQRDLLIDARIADLKARRLAG